MTKAEKIESLETKLRLERLEHGKTKKELSEYKKREEAFVIAQEKGAGSDGFRFYHEFVVYHERAPYGSGNFDFMGFSKALSQFLKKWNENAIASCTKNEYNPKGGKSDGE